MDKKISKIIKRINSLEVFPQPFLRRNKSSYAFVCLINNLIAFYLADNKDGIDACLRRLQRLLDSGINEIDQIEHKEYFTAAEELVAALKGGGKI